MDGKWLIVDVIPKTADLRTDNDLLELGKECNITKIEKEKYKVKNKAFEYDFLDIKNNKYYYTKKYDIDFSDIKGQTIAKKAALISAAGNHNILLEGSPGCGKSMIAKRLKYITAPMELEEILDIAKMESLQSKQPSFIPQRTFTSPHHSSTKASIVGGTQIGEAALSNHGILFLMSYHTMLKVY